MTTPPIAANSFAVSPNKTAAPDPPYVAADATLVCMASLTEVITYLYSAGVSIGVSTTGVSSTTGMYST